MLLKRGPLIPTHFSGCIPPLWACYPLIRQYEHRQVCFSSIFPYPSQYKEGHKINYSPQLILNDEVRKDLAKKDNLSRGVC